jgi:fructose-1,6-bisphosphatase/inositol monophosphatase family enzyme
MPAPPSPQEFVRVLGPALEQAAAIAAALEGRVVNEPKSGEDSAVKAALTIADTAAQEALLVPLLASFRSAQLEAEEDTHSVELFTGDADRLRIVIDPIDGTFHFFLGRRGPYAVMAGLAVAGRFEAALVALPREGLRCQALRGGGALRAPLGGELEPARPARGGRRVLLSDAVPEAVATRLRRAGFEVGLGCGGAVAVAPLVPGVCGGLRVARSGAISARGRIGALIAREAGALVQRGDGEPFPEALAEGADSLVVAADPETARALREALHGYISV